MKKMKRVVAVLLAVSVLVTMGTVTSFAAHSVSRYSETKPIYVSKTYTKKVDKSMKRFAVTKMTKTTYYVKRNTQKKYNVERITYKWTVECYKGYKSNNYNWVHVKTKSGSCTDHGSPQDKIDAYVFQNKAESEFIPGARDRWLNSGYLW